MPPPRPPVSPGPAAVPAGSQEQPHGVPAPALLLLRRLVAEALRCPVDRVRDDAPLDDLGLDSLGAVDLIAAVGAETGVRLAERELDDGVTTAGLADTLAARLGATTPSGAAPGWAPAVRPVR
ncbi:MAG: hypothetical protein AVDCRST_MAG66-3709 [uncultured Pseudonocardia sp.]|uniref:Carrier domain-containing protein n=1 Tax=uncultured Pseudonocardia sp. TaxID=211455 RepID=A0A6J4QH44_9PSEU|nr:MAG: hypothetical protein AVDCRST_MAG66-3709 [uncultured Pseudonocardia sp.]